MNRCNSCGRLLDNPLQSVCAVCNPALAAAEPLRRLAAAVAAVATEMDLREDELEQAGYRRNPEPARISIEEKVERILYPEHFQMQVRKWL